MCFTFFIPACQNKEINLKTELDSKFYLKFFEIVCRKSRSNHINSTYQCHRYHDWSKFHDSGPTPTSKHQAGPTSYITKTSCERIVDFKIIWQRHRKETWDR